MKPYSWFAASALGIVLSGPLWAQGMGDGNNAGASPAYPSAPIDNPTPNGPMPESAPLPINDPSKGSSQGDPGNRVPILAPLPGSTPETAGSSGTAGGYNSGAAEGQ